MAMFIVALVLRFDYFKLWFRVPWGWQRLPLVGPGGVAPRRMVVVSASVNLPLHH